MPEFYRNYAEFLKSPVWRRLRSERVIIAQGRCERCGCSRRLDVHHTFYRPRWEDTRIEDLLALCRKCHKKEHRKPGRT